MLQPAMLRAAALGVAAALSPPCLSLPWANDARADGPPPRTLEAGGTARVTEVVDGDTLALDDGRMVRLTGIQAPKLPLGRPGFETWPLAHEARAALDGIARGRRVELRFGGARMDRHGRVLAHLVRDDGLWLQGEMLTRGLARVYTFADNRALADALLARERAARAGGRGIWSDPYYAVLTPDQAGDRVDTFQLVEGRVLDAANVRGTVYLNFGPDWRTDFTVMLRPAARRLFEAEGRDPAALNGARVRARGWIKDWNGPMIEVGHPEQLEVITP